MSDYQITRTRKDGPDADRRIDAAEVGGQVYPVDTVISWIESGHRFYVIVNGKTVWVYVRTRNSRKYITTSADGYAANNLLQLPDC